MRAHKDYTGNRYGRLVALWPVERISRDKNYWMFSCDCGLMFTGNMKSVVSGHTSSCGCMAREALIARNTKHGLSKVSRRTYRTWKDMRARCYNENNKDYPNYGGRGIKVCDRWHEFSNFIEDMGDRPVGLTIDRINTNGNYEKENCRWATIKQQANNKRTNLIVGPNGETLAQMAEKTGIAREKMAYRFKNGLDPFTTEDLRK